MTVHSRSKKAVLAAVASLAACAFSALPDLRSSLRAEPAGSLRIVFWNVHNLFDTINDPRTQDDDYTPAGREEWTEARLQAKLKALALVIRELNPDIAGLAEVENIDVLRRLGAEAGYEHAYLIEKGDRRGIDIGVLSKIPLRAVQNTGPGRGILRLNHCGFTIAFAHWKSKMGGSRQTSQKREAAAQFTAGLGGPMLILGDFNESPREPARTILEKAGFRNLVTGACASFFAGSKKECIDGAYLRADSAFDARAEVAAPESLMQGRRPNPAISDHLPVIAEISKCP